MKSRLFHIFCASFSCCFSHSFFFVVASNYTGEVLLIMAYTTAGKLRPKGVPFFRLQGYERGGISLVEVYKRVGKCVISVCKMV